MALRTELVGKEELAKAKALITGSFEMGADRPIDLARWYGTGRLLGDDTSIEEATKAVRAVTSEQIQALAKRTLIKERQVLAVIGPYEDDKIFKRFLGI